MLYRALRNICKDIRNRWETGGGDGTVNEGISNKQTNKRPPRTCIGALAHSPSVHLIFKTKRKGSYVVVDKEYFHIYTKRAKGWWYDATTATTWRRIKKKRGYFSRLPLSISAIISTTLDERRGRRRRRRGRGLNYTLRYTTAVVRQQQQPVRVDNKKKMPSNPL